MKFNNVCKRCNKTKNWVLKTLETYLYTVLLDCCYIKLLSLMKPLSSLTKFCMLRTNRSP